MSLGTLTRIEASAGLPASGLRFTAAPRYPERLVPQASGQAIAFSMSGARDGGLLLHGPFRAPGVSISTTLWWGGPMRCQSWLAVVALAAPLAAQQPAKPDTMGHAMMGPGGPGMMPG